MGLIGKNLSLIANRMTLALLLQNLVDIPPNVVRTGLKVFCRCFKMIVTRKEREEFCFGRCGESALMLVGTLVLLQIIHLQIVYSLLLHKTLILNFINHYGMSLVVIRLQMV